MEKQISIIIPTYNMEKYIGKCLDSLLIPEFDQVEVLVVNDGSKDRSSEIAHNYADRYPDSIRVIDKPNGNYGSCINTALLQCTGRYVKVLDADDTFNTDAFSKFVKSLHECNEDVIITNFIKVDEYDKKISLFNDNYNLELNIHIDIDNIAKVFKQYVSMHRISYAAHIFNIIKYEQTEGISYTDAQWSVVPLSYCKSVRILPIVLYRYLWGRTGQTSDPKQVQRSISHYFKMIRDLTSYYSSSIGSTSIRDFLLRQILLLHRDIYLTALNSWSKDSHDMLVEHEKFLKEVHPDIYNSISELGYADYIDYRIFLDLRRHNYSLNFRIPLMKRIMISFQIRLKKMLQQ